MTQINPRKQNGSFKSINVVNLDEVTTATIGSSVNTEAYDNKSIFVTVSSNTGAVTVTVEGSVDGTGWVTIDATTWTSSNGTAIVKANDYYPLIRTKTTTQSTSTVKTTITGKN